MGTFASLAICMMFSYAFCGTIFVSTNGNSNSSCGDNIANACDSVALALSRSSNGDVINVEGGTYNIIPQITIPDGIEISIISMDGAEETIFDMKGTLTDQHIVAIPSSSSLVLQGITFINVYSSSSAIVLYSEGVVLIDSCVFTNITGTGLYTGSAVVLSYVAINTTITNSRFEYITIHNDNQTTDSFGCAILISATNATTIDRCSFKMCHGGDGAGVYVEASSVIVSHSDFFFNFAEGSQAGGSGGDIRADSQSEVFLFNSTFRNSSAFYGGSVSASGGSVYASECTFRYGIGIGEGGSFSVENGGNAKLDNCIVDSNWSPNYHGGAIYVYSSRLRASNTVFSNNIAENYGGAIAFTTQARGQLTNVQIFGNDAYDGGGIYLDTSSRITLIGVTIYNNTADDSGGGIYCSNSKMFINTTSVKDNHSPGAVDLECSHEPAYTFCTVTGDTYWSSQCGDYTGESSSGTGFPTMHPIVIIAIVMSVAAFIMVSIAIGLCIRWRKHVKKVAEDKIVWKKISTKPDNDDLELLGDYDDD